jgi:hypothetical protein
MVKNKRYTLAEQYAMLKSTYPNSKSILSNNSLTWYMNVQPLALSGTYTLKIVYSLSMAWPDVL